MWNTICKTFLEMRMRFLKRKIRRETDSKKRSLLQINYMELKHRIQMRE